MGEASRTIEFIEATFAVGIERGIAHLTAEDPQLDGRSVVIRGKPTVNFASCSYLGLELDARLKQGAIEATQRYGTQFSSSRSFISAPQYEELESLLDRIFDGHALVTPNTTLAHLSALPILISEDDAAILDHQVHQSVQMATALLRQQGTHVELVRHRRVDLLEQRICELAKTHRRVWYLADGVYSMYGDFAPMKALRWLLARHEQLNLYIDDAHGMSWMGRHGRGFALDRIPSQERVVVAVSLNKSFGAAGGAIVFPSAELRRKVRSCGGPMIFTGPIQPPMLGAAVASAKIHLSDEITALQRDLLERIRFANRKAKELDLPLASRCEVPIRCVGFGLTLAAVEMTEHLIRRGMFTNPAVFPAVGIKNSGLRFTLTRHHSFDDIQALLETVAEFLPRALAMAGTTREEVDRAFGLDLRPGSGKSAAPERRLDPESRARISPQLTLQHESSIHSLDRDEWNEWMGGRGSFGFEGLAFLERVFNENQKPENRWRFHYWVVRDAAGRAVAATFFTEALWKDDLLAPHSVSRFVEERRSTDPYFLTSRALTMGSLLTEGDHLYLDRGADWQSALSLLLAAVEAEREECQAERIVLRDLPAEDRELECFLKDAGFIRVESPDSMIIEIDWADRDEFVRKLSKRSRRFHREAVLPWEKAYEVEVLRPGDRTPSEDEWKQIHRLYLNVKGHNLALNTFPLPEDLFPGMMEFSTWEILLLRLRPEFGGDPDAPAQGFVASYVGPEQYAPMIAGMDYRYIQSHGLYRQLLSQAVHRAKAHDSARILLGMGAELEKHRFGAQRHKRSTFVQSHDHFQYDVLSLIASDPELRSEEE
ncbi:MAG: aminotransferase class I/II-fold pyridoxal phosphate-dependent enzyme [Myxococcota bacterium]